MGVTEPLALLLGLGGQCQKQVAVMTVVNEVESRMINNDYVRGYFDAHGYIYSAKRQRGSLRWRVVFQDQDKSQIDKVHTFLTNEGYHPCSFLRKNNGLFGPHTVQKVTIERQAEVERFIKEIGTEKSETQERFTQFLTGRIELLIERRRPCRGRLGHNEAGVGALPVAALGIIGRAR